MINETVLVALVRVKIHSRLEQDGYGTGAYDKLTYLFRSKLLHHYKHETHDSEIEKRTNNLYPGILEKVKDFEADVVPDCGLTADGEEISLTNFINRKVDEALTFGI